MPAVTSGSKRWAVRLATLCCVRARAAVINQFDVGRGKVQRTEGLYSSQRFVCVLIIFGEAAYESCEAAVDNRLEW